MLVVLVFFEILAYYPCRLFLFEFYTLQMMARVVCGVILHLCIVEEQYKGLNQMKYSVNHPYNFNNPHIAFFVSFLLFLQNSAVEMGCVTVII